LPRSIELVRRDRLGLVSDAVFWDDRAMIDKTKKSREHEYFMKDRRIVAVHGIRNKGQTIPPHQLDTARQRMRDWRRRAEP